MTPGFRTSVSAVTAILVLAAPTSAQSFGTIEVGGFGQLTLLDKTLETPNDIGGGGRLGIFVLPHVAIEGDVSYTSTRFGSVTVSYVPVHARLVANIPIADEDRAALLLGAGWVHNKYGKGVDLSDNGVAGLVGLRAMLTDHLSFRMDGAYDYIKSPANNASDNRNFALQVGLSLLFGRHAGREPVVAEEPARQPAPPPAAAPAPEPAAAPAPAPPPPPLDSDEDGVPDTADRCADTPRGETVDANGCSARQRDADADGVPDDSDRCPNTAAGTTVDANGCPVLFEKEKPDLVLEGVTFDNEKATLRPESNAVLDRVAQSLIGNPDVRIEIRGYTDSRGTRAYNQRLSQQRADAVKAYLEQKGVPADRMRTNGFGYAKPVATNATAEGRARNRRVELHRIGG